MRCNFPALLGANTYIQSCPPPSVILGIHLVLVISGDQHIPLHFAGRGLASKLPYTEDVLGECYNGSPPGIPGLTNGRTDKH